MRSSSRGHGLSERALHTDSSNRPIDAITASASGTAAVGGLIGATRWQEGRPQSSPRRRQTHRTSWIGHVSNEVTTDTKRVEVPVKREESVVERTDLDGQATGSIKSGSTEEKRIVLKEGQVDVNKRKVAKGAVEVGKRTVTDNETVSAKLKEEEINVDRKSSK